MGISKNEFNAVKEGIHAAISDSDMDISEELEGSRADHKKKIAEIRRNGFNSDEPKQERINALRASERSEKAHSLRQQNQIGRR